MVALPMETVSTTALDEATATSTSLKKVNKTNQVQDEMMVASELNTTTTVPVSIVITELTMTMTPHQINEDKGTI